MAKILSFEQEFTRRQPGRVQLLRFMREAIGVREVQWSDLTRVNLITVADYIKNVVTPNSAVTYFAVLKAFLATFKDEGIIPCSDIQNTLKAKKVPQQNVALTEGEVGRIVAYYDCLLASGQRTEEKDVLTLFLLEVFCGARSCDIEQVSSENIINGKLMYVSQKTHVLTRIPAHRRLAELLDRKPRRTYSAMTKNRTIKRVAKRCGINEPVTIYYRGHMQTRPKYEYLGTHSARRTFASILAAKHVPIAEISQYMGHTSISMTERYIKVDMQQASPEALEFFNG